MVFQRTDRIPAEQALGGVVQQFPQRLPGHKNLVLLPNLQDEQRLCCATERGSCHRVAPPHRLMRARLCARSSSVQQSKRGLRRSSRPPERKSMKARAGLVLVIGSCFMTAISVD